MTISAPLRLGGLWLVTLAGLTVVCHTRLASACMAEITFPDIPGNVLTLPENTNSTIHFRVNNVTCSSLTDMDSIKVTYKNPKGDEDLDFCTIRVLFSGSGANSNCNCIRHQDTLGCEVRNTFLRKHNGPWTFGGGLRTRNKIKKTTLNVNVTYPVVITSFTTGNPGKTVREVRPNAQPHVDCQWTEGNPKTPVVIVGPDNTELHRSDHRRSESLMRRALEPLGCTDTGDYRCVVKETNQSLALTLLVTCPLEFTDQSDRTVPATLGNDLKLSFDVISYTRDLAKCHLIGPNQGRNDNPGQSYSSCNSSGSEVTVEGSPPRLRLTLLLKNVTSQDDGRWVLEAGNGKETDPLPSVIFHLNVTAPEPPEVTTQAVVTTQSSSTDSGGEPEEASAQLIFVIGISVGCFIIVFLLIAIIICACRARKENKADIKRTSPKPKPDVTPAKDDDKCEMIVNDLYGSPEQCQMIQNDLYETSGDLLPAPGDQQAAPEAGEGEMYVGVEEVQKKKKKKKGKKAAPPPPPEEGGDVYVGAAEVQENKARQKAARMSAPPEPEEGGELYMGAADVQRNKARQRALNDAMAQGEDAIQSDEVPEPPGETNPDGLTYGQLDFSHVTPRRAVVTPLPATDYAEINFTAAPVRPPRAQTQAQP